MWEVFVPKTDDSAQSFEVLGADSRPSGRLPRGASGAPPESGLNSEIVMGGHWPEPGCGAAGTRHPLLQLAL
jgi:hypothetical protein